jgi:hypothetical protein
MQSSTHGPNWRAFVIAEADGKPVGVAQVRRHPDGNRELASLVVVAEDRGRRIATRMVDALLSEETQPCSLCWIAAMPSTSCGGVFNPIPATDLPEPLKRQLRAGQVVTGIGSLIRWQRIRLISMRRPPQSQAAE